MVRLMSTKNDDTKSHIMTIIHNVMKIYNNKTVLKFIVSEDNLYSFSIKI